MSMNKYTDRAEGKAARQAAILAAISEEEIATSLGITARTVQRDWAKARAWLHSELSLRATGQ